jgi:hypothetical protein
LAADRRAAHKYGRTPLRGGERRAILVRPDAIAHRTRRNCLDREADVDSLGKSQTGKIVAAVADREANDFAGSRIEQGRRDEQGIDRAVKKRIIGGVVDVAAGIISDQRLAIGTYLANASRPSGAGLGCPATGF